ncbi:MAG: YitT family protein [Paludibacteraceae bacterium]|nr:YitT family protein [Paludibacteraceae bacterium]
MDRQMLLNPKRHWVEIAREYLMIFLALAPFALMVNWIFVPHNVVGGGLTGICSIIYYATQGLFPALFPAYGGALPIWLTTLVINCILLLIAALTVGWRFCIRTVFGVFVLAFWYRLIPIREEALIEDPLLGCIVGGVLFGLSLGVVMLNNGSSGGTDIIAMVVNNYRDISLGKVMVICDVVIILSSYFLPVPEVFADKITSVSDFKIKRIMCGICMTVSYTAALDWLMSRIRQSVQFFIFSAKHAEIATAINEVVHRGVTVLEGKGWYSKHPIEVVMVLARKQEGPLILRLIKSIDPNAFVSYANVSGVFGQGFDRIKGK